MSHYRPVIQVIRNLRGSFLQLRIRLYVTSTLYRLQKISTKLMSLESNDSNDLFLYKPTSLVMRR